MESLPWLLLALVFTDKLTTVWPLIYLIALRKLKELHLLFHLLMVNNVISFELIHVISLIWE